MTALRPCACGCGRKTRGGDYNSECRNECACGCGGRTKYAYIPEHRPRVTCERCKEKEFTPKEPGERLCSACRRHVRSGGPVEKNFQLSSSRKMQAAAPPGRRWCSGCERYRLERFFTRRGRGFYSRCKPCFRVQHRASRVQRVYGIDAEIYDEIKAKQGGKCAICQIATGKNRALAVDHDHSCCSGRTSCGKCVRGVLCSRCNRMLGHGRDNPEFFARAIEYLANPPAKEVVDGAGEAREAVERDADRG